MRICICLVQAQNFITADHHFHGLYLPTAVIVECFSTRYMLDSCSWTVTPELCVVGGGGEVLERKVCRGYPLVKYKAYSVYIDLNCIYVQPKLTTK